MEPIPDTTEAKRDARLEAIARRAADAIAAAGATQDDELEMLRSWRAQDARLPARDLYQRLRHAEHVTGHTHPQLAKKLRRYGESVERLT